MVTGEDQVVIHELAGFECRASEDSVKTDLELTCTECGELLADVEAGDVLSVLVHLAAEHLETHEGEA